MVDAAEHLRPESSLRVAHFRLHLDRARLRIHGVRDSRDPAGERFARVSDEVDLHALARLHETMAANVEIMRDVKTQLIARGNQ